MLGICVTVVHLGMPVDSWPNVTSEGIQMDKHTARVHV